MSAENAPDGPVEPAGEAGPQFRKLAGEYLDHLASRHPDCVTSLLLSNIGAPDPNYAQRLQLAANLLAPLPEPLVHAFMRAAISASHDMSMFVSRWASFASRT
mgnify:CR=1 FL=1